MSDPALAALESAPDASAAPAAYVPTAIPAAEILAPFKGAAPSGEDLLTSNVYGQLKDAATSDETAGLFQESEKFKPKEGWRVADWRAVERLAVEVLTKRSKDIRVAGYLARALGERAGLDGMRAGLWLLVELQDRFWDTLNPEPEKIKNANGQRVVDPSVRVAEMQVVLDHLAKLLAANPRPDGDSEDKAKVVLAAIGALLAERDRIGAQLGERLLGRVLDDNAFSRAANDLTTSWREVVAAGEARREADAADAERRRHDAEDAERRAAEDAARRAQEEAERRRQLALLGIGSGDEPAAVAVEAGPAGGGERESAVRAALRAGQSFRRLDPADALAYRLMFAALWDAPNCKGVVEAPPEHVRLLLPRLHAEGNLSLLGDACMAAMNLPAARDWVDVAWYLSVVLAGLGESARPASTCVKDCLAARLEREPGWPESRFADGSPMTCEGAAAWIAEVIAESRQSRGGDGEAGLPREEVQKAADLARAGRLHDAVDLLQRHVEHSRSPRERFLRRLDFAEFCAANGAGGLADAGFRRLLADMSERGLESWESPRLLARIHEGVYHRARQADSDCADLGPAALEKLRLLDPRRALEAGA